MGNLTYTNSAQTFSNFDGPVFYSNKCNVDRVILENYYGLKIMRCVGSDYDQFFLKGDKLPEPDDLSEYTGLFSSRELNITYQIAAAEKWIIIRPVKKFPGTSLKMIAADIFISPEEGIKLRFKRNEKGEIDSFFLDSFRSMNYLFSKIK